MGVRHTVCGSDEFVPSRSSRMLVDTWDRDSWTEDWAPLPPGSCHVHRSLRSNCSFRVLGSPGSARQRRQLFAFFFLSLEHTAPSLFCLDLVSLRGVDTKDQRPSWQRTARQQLAEGPTGSRGSCCLCICLQLQLRSQLFGILTWISSTELLIKSPALWIFGNFYN